MQCSLCHLEHPRNNNAYLLPAFLDPAIQASANVDKALFITQNCAKAIVNGFERFEKQDKKINAIVLGRPYTICETTGLDNNKAMSVTAIRALVIQGMKSSFGPTL